MIKDVKCSQVLCPSFMNCICLITSIVCEVFCIMSKSTCSTLL
ncbi:unnamed protein product [Arabidopsis halleri]